MMVNSYNIDMKAHIFNPFPDQAEIMNRVCEKLDGKCENSPIQRVAVPSLLWEVNSDLEIDLSPHELSQTLLRTKITSTFKSRIALYSPSCGTIRCYQLTS